MLSERHRLACAEAIVARVERRDVSDAIAGTIDEVLLSRRMHRRPLVRAT
jgi:hypothetical protein